MSEQQPGVKVYELAKELGLDSISLLDRLNAINIKVKSHMSELSADDLRTARQVLGKKEAAAAKKPAVRTRKKAAETTEKAHPSVKAQPPAATAKPSVSLKRPAKILPEEPQAIAERKTTATVIRRRIKSDGALETVATIHTEEEIPIDQLQPSEAEPTQTVTDETAADALATMTETPATEVPPPVMTSGESIPTTSALPTAPAETAPPSQETTTPKAPPTKKTIAPIILRPTAVRKSILKIVQPAAPVRPTIIQAPEKPTPSVKPAVKGGTATQDKDGFRIIKMTKENLDQMAEEEAARKRGSRELDIRPEDVRFADYRKKEMVFLPKKKKLPVGKELKKTQKTTPKAIKRVVEVNELITVQDLANQLNAKASDVIRKLMALGQMTTLNQSIDLDTATLVANEYQYEVKNVAFQENALLGATPDQPETLKPRPPVVTIMGHVDHGKTSLLDAIRETQVAAGEAGGITQHIGAYSVEKNGKQITFIDTPGHEAFTQMRARGANVTDIVVLVVAADDGVMPQTREAISHAQAANVPLIVAINKIDKPGANPDKIKQSLAELNLLAEDWGGQTLFVPVSALKKTNLEKLLESILLQAEMLDLKANPNTSAGGSVIEARIEKGRGPMATLLVKRGTLRVGDPLCSGQSLGRVKAMTDHQGQTVKETTPGMAVEVLGFETLPTAGERFDVVASEADVHKIVENRINKQRARTQAAQTKVTLDDLFSKIQAGAIKEFNVILKTDAYGSLEAIRDSLVKLSTEKIKVKVILAAPGAITESDIMLASASSAIIIGFNVRPETKARQLAEAEHIDVKCYNIIYELIDDIKKAMVGVLDKKKVEQFLGRAEVRQTFSIPKVGTIAGSSVIDGKILRGANVRLLREGRIVFEGKLSSLKRFKDDAKEVTQGLECGISLENYNDLKPGDLIEAYQIEWVTPELTG